MLPTMFSVLAFPLPAVLLALLLCMSCQAETVERVREAAEQRAALCGFAEAWPLPELQDVRELCRKGAELEDLARAYGRCKTNGEPNEETLE